LAALDRLVGFDGLAALAGFDALDGLGGGKDEG